MTHMELTRRSFVITTAAAGGGLMLGVGAARARINGKPWLSPTEKEGTEISQWLAIDPEGIVTIRVPHTEQGQGCFTAVPMMINEELQADWNNIRAQYASPNRHVREDDAYVTMVTHGSLVVRARRKHLQQAGASARERLKAAAASAWGVNSSQVAAKDGVLSAGSNSGTYGEFAAGASQVTLAEEPAIRTPDEFQFLGSSVQRIDVPLKVNGSANYSIDTRLPGMVYAAVVNSPVPHGGAPTFDASQAMDRSGVVAVVEFQQVEGGTNAMRNGLAVVADSWYRAKTALELIPIEWGASEYDNMSSDGLIASAFEALNEPGGVLGDPNDGAMATILESNSVVTSDYFRPYETHARMEPTNATVSVTENRCDVWSPCNNQANGLNIVADQTGMDAGNVFVHTAFLGGAFGGGGSGNTPVTRQATHLSSELGRPVKVVWSREEDVMHDSARAWTAVRFTAAIGSDGLPSAWHTRISSPRPAGAGWFYPKFDIANMAYQVLNRHHEATQVADHIPTATHRAPGTNQNDFMVDGFIDEVALAGGWDPLEWRLKLAEGLSSETLVLSTLKEKSGFTTDLPKGSGMGVSAGWDHGTFCGACATVSVSRRGQLWIEKIVHVIDCGHVINPLNCKEQSEGASIYELSHAWMGGLEMKNGRFVNDNFDTYQLLKMENSYPHEMHLALSGGDMWGGMGEPSGPPTPGAVANAVFFATGKRMRTTPFKHHDLSWS